MPRVYEPENFAARVNTLSDYIANNRTPTRLMDTCCEMWDGDAVGVAVYRRSRKNPRMRCNIWRYLGRRRLVLMAFANRRRKTRDLPKWAAEPRRTAKAESDAFFARLAAERATSNHPTA